MYTLPADVHVAPLRHGLTPSRQGSPDTSHCTPDHGLLHAQVPVAGLHSPCGGKKVCPHSTPAQAGSAQVYEPSKLEHDSPGAQGLVAHSSMSTQLPPVAAEAWKPALQVHVYSLMPLVQLAPFGPQGTVAHSSMSMQVAGVVPEDCFPAPQTQAPPAPAVNPTAVSQTQLRPSRLRSEPAAHATQEFGDWKRS